MSLLSSKKGKKENLMHLEGGVGVWGVCEGPNSLKTPHQVVENIT